MTVPSSTQKTTLTLVQNRRPHHASSYCTLVSHVLRLIARMFNSDDLLTRSHMWQIN
jgi:hypothetical protein